jgi:hypothetical protein
LGAHVGHVQRRAQCPEKGVHTGFGVARWGHVQSHLKTISMGTFNNSGQHVGGTYGGK